MNKLKPLQIWAFSAALVTCAAVQAAGTPGAGAEKVPEGQSASDTAAAHYQTGLQHKAAALTKEEKAAKAEDPALRERLEGDARAEFEAAATAYGRALKLSLNHYEAANELGYALRKTGEYRKALGAYNFALVIKPDFYPAIEYRGEAYLALGRFDLAQEAYMTLFRNDLALAAQLLEAMSEVVKSEVVASEVASEGDEGFTAWVAERQALASVTPGGDAASERDW